jgi:hypothetical protein
LALFGEEIRVIALESHTTIIRTADVAGKPVFWRRQGGWRTGGDGLRFVASYRTETSLCQCDGVSRLPCGSLKRWCCAWRIARIGAGKVPVFPRPR